MTQTTSVRLSTCVVCRTQTTEGVTDITFDYGDFKITVEGVPVEQCAECDDNYVNGPLGVALSEIVSQIAEAYEPLVKRLAELKGSEVRKPYNEARPQGQLVYA